MSDERSRADRLAELRSEIQERIAEVQRLIGPERAPMLYPAAQAVTRECSRGFNDAAKEEATHVHVFVNADDYTGNAFCECGEQEGEGR